MKDEQNTNACLMEARLTFRQLLRDYSLLDLIGDSNESIAWFRQIMLELAGWVNDRERAREILRRFREECDRHREEQEKFERAGETGLPNPYSGRRFRRINILRQGFTERGEDAFIIKIILTSKTGDLCEKIEKKSLTSKVAEVTMGEKLTS